MRHFMSQVLSLLFWGGGGFQAYDSLTPTNIFFFFFFFGGREGGKTQTCRARFGG